MTRIQKIAVGAVALMAVSGAGAAVAATQLRSPQEESRAVVNDAARELGVTPEQLSNALKTAMKNRIDEAVQDGRLTQAQGNRLKQAIDEQDVPMLGPGPGLRGGRHFGPGFHRKGHFGPHHFAKLEVAAKYFGMTQAALRDALQDGKTLAQVARDRDKSVDGLIDALVAEKRERINAAVEDGDLTRAQANELLEDLRTRVTDMVNGRFPRLERGRFNRFEGPGRPPLILPTY